MNRWWLLGGVLALGCGDDSAGEPDGGGTTGPLVDAAAATGGTGATGGEPSTRDGGAGSGGSGGAAPPDTGGKRTKGDSTITFEVADESVLCREVPCPRPFTHIEITAPGASEPLALAFPGCGTVICQGCVASVCPNACEDSSGSVEPAEAESLTWDGGHWESATCNGDTPCVEHTFASPGAYTARLCAQPAADADCGSLAEPTCVEVPFDYPSDETFTGTLEP